MQVEFNESHKLASVILFTINRCENLSHDESMTLRQLSDDIKDAIMAILHGMISQIDVLYNIRTDAIPAMVNVYQHKDKDQYHHVLSETIPSFLNPNGTDAEFKEAVDKFRTKLDAAIAQKENAWNLVIAFPPLDLTHMSHRSVPASYAQGVLRPSLPPIGKIVADTAVYDHPNVDHPSKMRRGLKDFLINKLTRPPSYVPSTHASLQSKFYHTPENPPPPPPRLNNPNVSVSPGIIDRKPYSIGTGAGFGGRGTK
jgi:hypothetical protein